MSEHDNKITSSELDAFRSDGVIQTRSIVLSGTVGAGAEYSQTATSFQLPDLDFYQILFDNSAYSPSKFRDLELEGGTFVLETTNPSELNVWFEVVLTADTLTITAKLFNPYAFSVDLQSTTLNFRFVAYDSTLL